MMAYQTLCQTDIFIKLRATLKYKREKPMVHTGPPRLVFPAETLQEMREQPVISGQNAQKVEACADSSWDTVTVSKGDEAKHDPRVTETVRCHSGLPLSLVQDLNFHLSTREQSQGKSKAIRAPVSLQQLVFNKDNQNGC